MAEPEFPLRIDRPISLYKSTPQVGFLSVFYASMEHPLNIWEKQIRGGYIRRLFDEDGAPALQILGSSNGLSTFITAPYYPYSTLGISLNFLVLIIRKVGRMFTFEVQIEDDTGLRRRFRFCNYQIMPRKNISTCYFPVLLQDGWNEVIVDLAEYTRKSYGTKFVECVRLKIYPSCRVRQVYFTATELGYQRVLNIMRTTLSNNVIRIPRSTEHSSYEDLILSLSKGFSKADLKSLAMQVSKLSVKSDLQESSGPLENKVENKVKTKSSKTVDSEGSPVGSKVVGSNEKDVTKKSKVGIKNIEPGKADPVDKTNKCTEEDVEGMSEGANETNENKNLDKTAEDCGKMTEEEEITEDNHADEDQIRDGRVVRPETVTIYKDHILH